MDIWLDWYFQRRKKIWQLKPDWETWYIDPSTEINSKELPFVEFHLLPSIDFWLKLTWANLKILISFSLLYSNCRFQSRLSSSHILHLYNFSHQSLRDLSSIIISQLIFKSAFFGRVSNFRYIFPMNACCYSVP